MGDVGVMRVMWCGLLGLDCLLAFVLVVVTCRLQVYDQTASYVAHRLSLESYVISLNAVFGTRKISCATTQHQSSGEFAGRRSNTVSAIDVTHASVIPHS